MAAASSRFRSVREEDLDSLLVEAVPEKTRFWTTSRFILKQLDYSLSISMRDSWLGLRPRELSRDRNLDRAHNQSARVFSKDCFLKQNIRVWKVWEPGFRAHLKVSCLIHTLWLLKWFSVLVSQSLRKSVLNII